MHAVLGFAWDKQGREPPAAFPLGIPIPPISAAAQPCLGFQTEQESDGVVWLIVPLDILGHAK